MKVSDSVLELERQFREMRDRAERAEGIVRVYEARHHAQAAVVSDQPADDFQITTRDSEKGDHSVKFSPGMWLLMLAEDLMRNPRPLEVRVEALTPTDPNVDSARPGGGEENLQTERSDEGSSTHA